MPGTYDVDEHPPFLNTVLLGLQWTAIVIPIVVVIGRIVADVHLDRPIDQVLFMQKTAFLIAVTIAAQVLFGHRLPLVAGPATVLVVGLMASKGFSRDAVYTSMMTGGLILALAAATGLFAHIRRLFTPRVVAVILILIAFTLAPTIISLVTDPAVHPPVPARAGFATVLTLAMFLAGRYLKGVWKSTLILWSIVAGTAAAAVLFPGSLQVRRAGGATSFAFLTEVTTRLSFEPGLLFSFLVCYVGLAINDLGSIESAAEMTASPKPGERLTRGITATGLANIVAGFFGTIGPVNYSLSPGVIAATGNASRFTLLPTAVFMALLACSSTAFAFIGAVPSVVIGSVFLYLMTYQIAAGLMMASEEAGGFRIEDGLVMGLPLLIGTIVAFMPPSVAASFPPLIRPIAGNGFVAGVVGVLILEHFIYPRRD